MKSEATRYGAVIAILAATAIAAKMSAGPPETLLKPLDDISMEIRGWTGSSDPALREDILESLAPTSYLSRTYERNGSRLNLFVAYYANQKAGESMHSPKHCLPGAGWEIASTSVAELPWGAGTAEVNRHNIQKEGERMSVLYWYQSKRRIIADEYKAKVFLMRDAILERRTGGAIVRIIGPDDAASVEAATEFGAGVMAEVQRCMTGVPILRTENK
jgi:EpsI family protein